MDNAEALEVAEQWDTRPMSPMSTPAFYEDRKALAALIQSYGDKRVAESLEQIKADDRVACGHCSKRVAVFCVDCHTDAVYAIRAQSPAETEPTPTPSPTSEWTKGEPKEDGYYFLKTFDKPKKYNAPPPETIELVKVTTVLKRSRVARFDQVRETWVSSEQTKGEWLGPLSPSTFRPVADWHGAAAREIEAESHGLCCDNIVAILAKHANREGGADA